MTKTKETTAIEERVRGRSVSKHAERWDIARLYADNARWHPRTHYPSSPGAQENFKFFPLVAQVFPTYDFEAWDEMRVLPVKTRFWTARVFLLETDPGKTQKPRDPHDPVRLRVLVGLIDNYKSQVDAKDGALKLARDMTTLLPSILRARRAGKPLTLAPIKGSANGRTIKL
jgi:hypothetical protein